MHGAEALAGVALEAAAAGGHPGGAEGALDDRGDGLGRLHGALGGARRALLGVAAVVAEGELLARVGRRPRVRGRHAGAEDLVLGVPAVDSENFLQYQR